MGPAVLICDECVQLSYDIIGDECKGCGTDPDRACLWCCRVMLHNYMANHGTRCDTEQERLALRLEACLVALSKIANYLPDYPTVSGTERVVNDVRGIALAALRG